MNSQFGADWEEPGCIYLRKAPLISDASNLTLSLKTYSHYGTIPQATASIEMSIDTVVIDSVLINISVL